LGTNLTNQNLIQEEIKRRMLAIIRCRIFCLPVCYPKDVKIKMHRTIILPVVLYECGTWSLTLREKRGLRVFENRVLRRIFRLGRDEVTGEWIKLHIEDLNDLYSSPNIIRVIKSKRMRWVGHVARMRDRRGAYRVVVGRQLGRLGRSWDDNIKIDLQEVGWGGMDWIGVAQVASCCECGNEHSGSIKYGKFLN